MNNPYLCVMKRRIFAIILLLFTFLTVNAAKNKELLTGRVIGTELSVDYSSGKSSTTVNTKECAFDGDLSTYFASYDRSRTWVGLDLGSPHVISSVAWSPRNDGLGPGRMILGLFEGANQPDFSDAIPLYLIDQAGEIGKYCYAAVHVSRAFRYVRYIGPDNARCNVAEVQFYGFPDVGSDLYFYTVTNLPTLVIRTENARDPYSKDTEVASSYSLIYENGTRIQEEEGLTRLRGNASNSFPKKPYRLKLAEKKHLFKGDTSSKRSPSKAKKWTLINNYGDKTLMRNIVSFEVARRMGMPYVPWCEPVDVILNGEYRGCYQLCDQITVNKNRVDITEMSPEDTSGDALTGGYLLELDGYATQETSWFNSSRGLPFTIKSPADDEITTEQHKYIENFVNQIESRIMTNSFANPQTGYRSLFDAKSLITYFLTEEITGNPDAFHSCYMYKERGEDMLRVGPVWDFDLAFDNDSRFTPYNDLGDFLSLARGGAGNSRTMLKRLFTDTTFTDTLKLMWNEARTERNITEESLIAYIDSTAALLQRSQRLNFLRWPILNDVVHLNPVVTGSYEGEVELLRKFVRNRLPWLDIMVQSKNARPEEVPPMEIENAEDMLAFINKVNSGQTQICGNLKADIDISVYGNLMMNNYTGTFSGEGHCITLAYNTSQENTALFRNLSGTVEDLTVRGSIQTSGKYAASIAGTTDGANILRCSGEVDIASSVSGDGTHGTLVGVSNYTLIEDCLGAGSIRGSQTNCCGGLVGWATSATTIKGCLMVSDITVSTSGSDLLCRNSSNVTAENNICCTDFKAGNGCGAERAEKAQLLSGATCFHLNMNTRKQPWRQLLGTDSTPNLNPGRPMVYCTSRLHCNGTPYDANPSYSNNPMDNYQDQHQLQDGICLVCGLCDDSTMPRDHRGYFEIASDKQLKWFAEYVNTGNTTASAVLTKDIDFSSYTSLMIGDNKHFQGTFDGAGHTITVNLRNASDNTALFRYLDGTVQDLSVKGDVYSSAKFAGGIAAQMFGATLLRCQSYVNIHATISGDGTHGGLTGLTSDAARFSEIESCLFKGTIEGNVTSCCGGFVGWATAGVEIRNSLMIGDITVGANGSDMLCRNNANMMGYNNYYLTSWQPQTIPAGCEKTDELSLADGSLCYDLNSGKTDGTQNWYQTLSEDLYPVPDPTHDGVMKDGDHYTGIPLAGGYRDSQTPLYPYKTYDLKGVKASGSGKGILISNGKKRLQ